MMTGLTVTGVIPDCRRTAVVVRDGDELLDWEQVERHGGGALPDAGYLERVLKAVDRAIMIAGVGVVAMTDLSAPDPPDVWNAAGAMGISVVQAAVLAEYGIHDARVELVVVPRRRFGTREPHLYPVELHGEPSCAWGRAAWDVAGVGAQIVSHDRGLALEFA